MDKLTKAQAEKVRKILVEDHGWDDLLVDKKLRRRTRGYYEVKQQLSGDDEAMKELDDNVDSWLQADFEDIHGEPYGRKLYKQFREAVSRAV